MKNFKCNIMYFFAFVAAVSLTACDNDEEGRTLSGVSFERTLSSFSEGEGNGTLEVKLLDAPGNVTFSYGGTATEGEDYTVGGYSNGVLTLNLIDDNTFEPNETIRIQIANADGGAGRTRFHTVNISSNCEDNEGLDLSYFAGLYAATEKYGPNPPASNWYGPYDIEFVQDETDPTIFHFDNFYDSGCEAYVVVDMENGTVHFPDQAPCGVDLTNSSGTFVIDECNGTTFTINLNFDDTDWVYHFAKH